MVPLPHGQTNPKTSFLVLHEGKLIFDGSTAELVSSPDPFIKEFLA
jgi:phospholipid/cholesterol/gamma-HCH transport system ATP-binding protein